MQEPAHFTCLRTISYYSYLNQVNFSQLHLWKQEERDDNLLFAGASQACT